MSYQGLFAIGARLIGVYFLVSGITSIPGIATAYEASLQTSPDHAGIYVASTAAQLLLVIVAGFWLVARYRQVPVNSEERFVVDASLLELAVKLFGLWFAISGLVGLVGGIGEAFVVGQWSFRISRMVSSFLYATVGVFFLLRSSLVAGFLSTIQRSKVAP